MSDESIDRVFAVMALAPQPTFLVLSSGGEDVEVLTERQNDNDFLRAADNLDIGELS